MSRILKIFNNGIVFWVLGLGFAAFLYPSVFTVLKNSINIFFSLAMFGIGLVITNEDYKYIIRSPLKIIFGVICQFTIMPLLALLTSSIFHLSTAWTVGLILTGAAPGAMTSNVISYLSKSDVAFSVSLTAISTILCPILTPLITLTLAGTRVPIAFLPMFKTIVLVVVLPLMFGFIIRRNFARLSKNLREWPAAISVAAIVMITSYVIAANRDNLSYATLLLIGAVAFHNALGMALGFFAGYLAKFDYVRRKTLSIEIGMQNAGLGVILALNHFGKEVAIPAAIFTIWCIVTASLLVYFWSFIEKKKYV